MSKRSKRRQHGSDGLFEERLRAARVAVKQLLEEGRPAEAHAVLTRLEARHPNDPRVLEARLDLTDETGDMQRHQATLERLVALRPDDPELALALAGAALSNTYPVTGLQGFRRFLERWPSHPSVSKVRETVAEVERVLPEYLALVKASGEEAALAHERIQHLLSTGQAREAHEAAQRALDAGYPSSSALLNNLGRAAWMEGELAQAEASFRQVLASDPHNVHALANLAPLLLSSGRTTEAFEVAGRLKASTAPASIRWLKQAEALSFLGDDVGVLECFEKHQREARRQQPAAEAQLHHLAAVAALRQGEPERARRLWKKALERMRALELALRNLEALDLSAALRPIPWAFPLEAWLSPPRLRTVLQRMKTWSGKEEERRHARARLLEDFPELRHLLPLWLDRGSPDSVRLALMLCGPGADAALLEEVKRFALGERGTIDDRIEAARVVLSAGVAREEELLLWTGKRRQPYRWLDIETHQEVAAGRPHSRRVEKLLERALELLRQGDGKPAERLLREALDREPDAPDLLNNLAAARQLQGHAAESERMLEELHQRWPDYFFARCAVASLRIRDGRMEEARELLEPLLSQRRLHVTEVLALCPAQLNRLLAEGDLEGAEIWFHIVDTLLPEEPRLEPYRDLLALHSSLLGGLGRWLRGWKKK